MIVKIPQTDLFLTTTNGRDRGRTCKVFTPNWFQISVLTIRISSNVVLKYPIRVLCCLKATSGNNWTWTSGLSIISRMLYQLSYVSKVGTIGFEPITPCSSNKCSTNWRYVPIKPWLCLRCQLDATNINCFTTSRTQGLRPTLLP